MYALKGGKQKTSLSSSSSRLVSRLGGGGRLRDRSRLGFDCPSDGVGVRLLLGSGHAVDVHGQKHAIDHENAPVTRVHASAEHARLRPDAAHDGFAAGPSS